MTVKKGTAPGSLERAIAIAAEVHAGVTDKGGAPYILHPLRVMLRLTDAEARITAVLHDVVEDGGAEWTLERLRGDGFSESVIAALASVTKTKAEEDAPDASREEKLAHYFAFIRRAAANPIGRSVKLADLEDNLDTSRLGVLTEKDHKRLAKYRQARELLLALPDNANGGSSS